MSTAKRGSARNSKAVPARSRNTRSTSNAASTRRVVVSRRLVHGRWVRTTQVVHTAGPSYQAHPEPQRYVEIQQALANQGYFKGEANGTWGDDSVAALKQFETDHNIPNDGKITSLALIGLGLGPNREAPAKAAGSAELNISAPPAQQ